MSKLKIVFVGGGSYQWMPKLLYDFNQTESLRGSTIVLLDINLKAAMEFKEYGDTLSEKNNSRIRYVSTNNENEAFKSADFILIMISTGGMKADVQDFEIAWKYKNFQMLGDTAGPGGWSRTWRNAPVLVKMVEKMERLSKKAVVLNYTNPMADLTGILSICSPLPVIGMCHGPLETKVKISRLLGVDMSSIDFVFGGLNHFHWVLKFTVNGKDGYSAIKRRLKGKTLFEYPAVRSKPAWGETRSKTLPSKNNMGRAI